MLNFKEWMTKINNRLYSLRDLQVVADDYFAGGTTGQTHTYSLLDTRSYLLFCGKINGTGSGIYSITGHAMNTIIEPILNSSIVTITASGLTLSVKVDANYMRVTLIKVGGGGGNKLPYPLNRIAQILLRKEVGVC